MLVTDDEQLHARVMHLRDHGREPGDVNFQNTEVAFKYKMPPVAAAIGLAQLERVEELVTRKREIFSWYLEGLSGVKGVTLNQEPRGMRNSYWMVTALLDPELDWPKEKLMAALGAAGIDSRPMFHPLSSLPAYTGTASAEVAAKRNSTSYQISPWGINLPSALCLDRKQVDRVIKVLRQLLSR